MKWIDLFQFLNERANDFKNLGKFDWQANIRVYDNKQGDIYDADLIELHNLKKPEIYIQINSGEN